MIALKKFIYIFAFIGLCSLVSGCEDRAVASSNNMIRAINKVISNEEVMIAIPCMSLRDDKVVPPFVIIDPMLKELGVTATGHQKDIYLNRIVKYAKVMEKSGAINLKKSRFKIHMPFVGIKVFNGYEVDYNPDIARTLQISPYYGLAMATIGTLQVNELIKTTTPYFEDGIKYVDITFTVKIDNLLSCIDDDTLIESFAKEEVDNAKATYRLYLDKDSLEWKVQKPKKLNINPLRKSFVYLVEQ